MINIDVSYTRPIDAADAWHHQIGVPDALIGAA
jgi:hypothetical protein